MLVPNLHVSYVQMILVRNCFACFWLSPGYMKADGITLFFPSHYSLVRNRNNNFLSVSGSGFIQKHDTH